MGGSLTIKLFFNTEHGEFVSTLGVLLHIVYSQELVQMPATWSRWPKSPSSQLMKGGPTSKSSSTPSGAPLGNMATLTNTSLSLMKLWMPSPRTRNNSRKDGEWGMQCDDH